MKATLKQENQKKQEQQYPYIGIGDQTGLVVLFTEKGEGMVLNDGRKYSIGKYSKGWSMSYFKPLKGSIELSND